MNCYADTSYLVAYFAPKAEQSIAIHRFTRGNDLDYYFNPLLRAELRHNLRRIPVASHRATAWNAYRAAEKWNTRLVPHPFELDAILMRADKLSESDAGSSGAGTWDFIHIAIALMLDVNRFLTCDKAQVVAARTAGLTCDYFG